MTKEEIYPSVLEYFKGDELAAGVFIDKYALKDKEDVYYERTPDDMHRRLAKELHRIESKYPNPLSEDTIYNLLKDFKYVIPQGSPMFGIGNDYSITSLSNCFVIGNNGEADSYGSIMRTDQEQVQIMKRRGGVGHDLSHLRPFGAMANNSVLKGLSGSVAYGHRYSNSTKEVSQGERRGALMLSQSVKHPDIERLIDAKMVSGAITGANISPKVSDEFMYAVKNDLDYYHTFPINLKVGKVEQLNLPYNELKQYWDTAGNTGYIKRIKAKDLWNKIIHNAWQSAEPGVLFWDRILRESPADGYGVDWATLSTNPCGELPLCPYDSCRLLVINLFSYVVNPFQKGADFDTVLFKVHVKQAQRLLDDIIDLEIEKIDKIIAKILDDPEDMDIKTVEYKMWIRIREKAINGRRTGLGITAEGDMLAALGMKYGSQESIFFAENIHRILAISSYEESIDMAVERGAFPIFDYKNETSDFLTRIKGEMSDEYMVKWENVGRRNIANLTIAPTGSVSILTQTTSGIEPCFKVYYKRRRRTEDPILATFTDDHGEMFIDHMVFHHKFIEWYEWNWYKTDYKLYDNDFHKPLDMYTESELDVLISKSPWAGATSADINWVDKVKLQGAVQKWVDHSISATTNIPKETTEEVVAQIYMAAYEEGCKGMTVYREGSRSGILVSSDEGKKPLFEYRNFVKRPEDLECDIYHKTALKKEWTILIGKLEGKPYEVFAFPKVENSVFPERITKGHTIKVKSRTYKLVGTDGDKTYSIPNIIELIDKEHQVDTRKFSLMLRFGVHPRHIIKDIEEYALISSFEKVVQRVLRNYITDGDVIGKCQNIVEGQVCGGDLKNENGCTTCSVCGSSKCG